MSTQEQIKEYWERCTPLRDEDWPYQKKRDFRYNQLQTYQLDTIKFERFQGKYVLEVGCGAGIDALEFARHGAIVTATDITDDALQLTTKHALQADKAIDIVQLHGNTIPWAASETYDVVYSFGVLHHIPDVKPMLSEIARVLRPNGIFICMLYHKNSILYEYSIKHLHENEKLNEDELLCKYSERNVGCPYTKAYTIDEAYDLMKEFFLDVSIVTRYNVIDLPSQRKVKLQLPEGHPLGWHLILECRK